MKEYYVYILSTKLNKMLYIWVTNNLERRVYEHKNDLIEWFTKKYKCKKLIYFEIWNDINLVIEREKQLKRWSRQKKLELVYKENQNLLDLSINW